MKRRDFFAVLGGGIVVLLDDEIYAQETGGPRRGEAAPVEIGAWLHIGETGEVTVYTGKVEVGQNARTSLTQAVVEELHAPLASIKIVMADTDLTPFDIGTVGSMTTPRMWPQIRRAAAAAREMLLDLAAQKWSVDRASLAIADGKVSAGGRSAGFGELARGEKWTRTIPSSVPLAEAAAWKAAGKSLPKVNGREMVTGAHKYSYDLKRPGMLHAKMLYPPQFGATLVSLDASAAEAMPGVKVVHEGNFVAVAAPEPDTAAKAVAALKAEWKPVTAEADSRSVFQYFKQTAQGGAPRGEPDAVHHRLHRARSAGAARGAGRVGRRQGHRMDRLAAALRRAQRARAGIRHRRREGARDRAGYRVGLRRQAQWRRRARGRAYRESRRQAGKAQLDRARKR